MRRLSLVVAMSIALAACGALFNGGPANVAFNSNPTGAEVWIEGVNRGVTPVTLPMEKNRNHTITLKKRGHADETVEVRRQLSSGYLVLDILGGLLPVIVDASTGSWYVLNTANVSVNLRAPMAQTEGQLTPEQLLAVRLGTPLDRVLNADEILGQGVR